jgi:hypothetical protein
MGFYDPCPGDPKLLVVEYTFHGWKYKVDRTVILPYHHFHIDAIVYVQSFVDHPFCLLTGHGGRL